MSDDAHSLLSASGGDGWIPCNGKVLMETGRRTSSRFADEGTAAHTLADWVITRVLAGEPVKASAYLGRKIEVKNGGEKRAFTVDTEFVRHVQDYVDTALGMTEGHRVLRWSEQRVHYNEFLGVKPALAWGTSDLTAILMNAPALMWDGQHFPAGVEAQVHDLKFGKGVRVFASGSQPKFYGLGLLQDFDLVADITRVRMVIHQPRLDHVDEVVISADDLRTWAEQEAKPAAQRVVALMARPELQPPPGGWQDVREVPKALIPHLKPTDKGCRFCDAKAICPALIGEVQEAVSGGRSVASDFMDLTVDKPSDVRDYGDNWLAMFASKLDRIETLTKAARAEIDRRVLSQGKKVPGFKVVQGAKGDRTWTDKGAAEERLKALRLGDAAYTQKLITPPQAEKLLKKAAPQSWLNLQDLITRADGKPAVVHESDPRPEYTGHKASASDFQDVVTPEGTAHHTTEPHPFR